MTAAGRGLAALAALALACAKGDGDTALRIGQPSYDTGAPPAESGPPGGESDPPGGDSAPAPGDSGPGPGDTGAPPAPYHPALYPADQVQSPITDYVADHLLGVTGAHAPWQDDVFMKVGASSTASSNTLHCFADDYDLADHEAELGETLAFFQGGDAAGSTPFDRDTLAAVSGRTAAWAIDGAPSPIEAEIDAISPRLAVVHYGTNDMGMGSTYDSAMPGFYEAMMALLGGLLEQGILPIVTGISPRADSASADEWVAAYNALIRGMAQAWQVPFIDLQVATAHLDGYGLSSDGLHLEAYDGGACVLTDEGLEHGYNVRNLIVLRALDRVARVALRGEAAPDPAGPAQGGSGAPDDPFVIAGLPFAHTADTAASPHDAIDVYSGCSDTDESGPELRYRLELDRETAIRAVVVDQGSVDADLHLLDASADPDTGCLARADRLIEGTLAAGTYYLSLDTWVDGDGEVRAGEYTVVVVTCDAGDGDCADALTGEGGG